MLVIISKITTILQSLEVFYPWALLSSLNCSTLSSIVGTSLDSWGTNAYIVRTEIYWGIAALQ